MKATIFNSTMNDVRSAFLDMYNLHNKQIANETNQQQKRDRIQELKDEMAEATSQFDNPDYEGRDMSRIASDLKRINGQLDSALDCDNEYFDNIGRLVNSLYANADALKREVNEEIARQKIDLSAYTEQQKEEYESV